MFRDRLGGGEHLALTLGEPFETAPVLVRVHAINVLSDLLGYGPGDGDRIPMALRRIEREGRGTLVMVQEMTPTGISERLHGPAADEDKPQTLRLYGVGAGILKQLGLSEITLLTNSPPPRIAAIRGYGLHVAGAVPLGADGGHG